MVLVVEAEGRTAEQVMHGRLSTLPASTTVAELRTYFGESTSRRLALVVQDGRYVGAIPVTAVTDDLDDSTLAADLASPDPTVLPGDSAVKARDLALALPSRRVPVVDVDGTLVGIVAIDKNLERFCGAG